MKQDVFPVYVGAIGALFLAICTVIRILRRNNQNGLPLEDVVKIELAFITYLAEFARCMSVTPNFGDLVEFLAMAFVTFVVVYMTLDTHGNPKRNGGSHNAGPDLYC